MLSFHREGSLLCHTCWNAGPRFLRYHSSGRPLFSPCTINGGHWGPIYPIFIRLKGVSFSEKRGILVMLQYVRDWLICLICQNCMYYSTCIWFVKQWGLVVAPWLIAWMLLSLVQQLFTPTARYSDKLMNIICVRFLIFLLFSFKLTEETMKYILNKLVQTISMKANI